MTVHDSTTYVPLFEFSCQNDVFIISPGMRLQRFTTLPAISLEALSKHERSNLQGVGHWLVFDPNSNGGHSISARMNHWTLALWLVRSTRLLIRFRFEESSDGASSCFTRLLSRPNWNKEDVEHGSFSIAELTQAQRAFVVLESIPTDSRLGMALSLTAEGNWQHRWHAAIVLYSAALETLLTCDRGRGLTTRLAHAYSALVAPGTLDRNPAEATFRAAYDVRSGIMHGRNNLSTEGSRLRALALWSGIIRDVWQVVVVEPAVLSALQDTDSMRKAFLDAR